MAARPGDAEVGALPGSSAPVLLVCTLLGAVVALGLAALMSVLVTNTQMRLEEAVNTQLLDFVRVKRSETANRRERRPERPAASEVPEAPAMAQDSSDASAQQIAVSVQAPTDLGSDLAIDGNFAIGSGDGEYLPIVKVAPVYPRRAISRQLTGECLVRYTVTAVGTVRDVEVVKDRCSDPVFREPSVEAAKRFRYKPRVVDGEAIEVHGVQNLFHYERAPEAGGGPA